jgi:hypothetical protein
MEYGGKQELILTQYTMRYRAKCGRRANASWRLPARATSQRWKINFNRKLTKCSFSQNTSSSVLSYIQSNGMCNKTYNVVPGTSFVENPRQVVYSRVVKSLERPLGLQEIEAPRISRQPAHEGSKVASPTHRPPLSQQRVDHSAAGRIKSLKDSNGRNGNRTCDLPACSAVSQPTAYARSLTVARLYTDFLLSHFQFIVDKSPYYRRYAVSMNWQLRDSNNEKSGTYKARSCFFYKVCQLHTEIPPPPPIIFFHHTNLVVSLSASTWLVPSITHKIRERTKFAYVNVRFLILD